MSFDEIRARMQENHKRKIQLYEKAANSSMSGIGIVIPFHISQEHKEISIDKKNIMEDYTFYLSHKISANDLNFSRQEKIFIHFDFTEIVRNACKHGLIEVLYFLTDPVNTFCPKIDDDYFEFCLRDTIEYGHLHIIKYLEKLGADLNFEHGELLFLARSSGSTEIVQYLESIGLDDQLYMAYKTAGQLKSRRLSKLMI